MKYTKGLIIVLFILSLFSFSLSASAARVDFMWVSGTLRMEINPQGMGIGTLISAAKPVPAGTGYSNITRFGMAVWEIPTDPYQYYEDQAGTIGQSTASSTIILNSGYLSSVVGKTNAYVVIGAEKYYINTYLVEFYLNGVAMTKHTDGQNYIFNLSGVTTPTPTVTPTPTAAPVNPAIISVYTTGTPQMTVSIGSSTFSNLFFNTTSTSEISKIGVQYYYTTAPYSDQEMDNFTGFPQTLNLNKIRAGGTKINIIIESNAGDVRFANTFYWDLYLNGTEVLQNEGTWVISPDGTTLMWDFANNSNGWLANAQVSYMDPGVANVTDRGLGLSANSSSRCFAYWTGPAQQLSAGRYKITFTVSSSAGADMSPTFRIRANETIGWRAWDMVINSISGAAPFAYSEKEYILTIDLLESSPVNLSFDIMSFDSSQSTSSYLYLKKVMVEK